MIIEGAKAGGGSFRQTPDNLRSTDSLEALLGICAGPVVGPVRGQKSITIDGTPLEDESGQPNFQDFNAVVADGDPAKHPQIAKMQLGGGSSPTNVGLSITNPNVGSPGPWVSKTIANTNADALDLRFIVSQLYWQDKKGIYSLTANLEIQMKPTGTATWINPTQQDSAATYDENGIPLTFGTTEVTGYFPVGLFDGGGDWAPAPSAYFAINGKTTSPYVYELRVAVPNEGPYAGVGWDVRVRLIEKDDVEADPVFEKRTMSWESISAVYLDPIGGTEAWRGLAWMYIYGKASDQLSGIPEISGPWKTKICSVPNGSVYDPETRVYNGAIWDGTYSKAFTQDPAWIINDAISDPLFGIAYLAPGSYLNKWDALEASKWFSELVPDGDAGTEPRYSLNLVVDQPQKSDEMIQYLAGAVGGIAWDTGSGEWRLKIDKPENPVDIFTLENIEGDFNYSHTDIDARFNDITMAFRNAEFDYREDRVRVWDQDHIDKYGRKPTTLVAVGSTGRQETYRRAMLRLRSSINEWRTVSFTTNRRGRMVRPLDTILVADCGLGYTLPTGIVTPNPGDLDQTNNRTTGRVVSYNAGAVSVTLRDTVRLEIGATYTLSYSSPNPNYTPDASVHVDRTSPTIVTTVNILNNSGQRGDVTELFLSAALPGDIPEYATVAISAVGLPSMPRAYRVLSVKPEDDGERMSISAIEIDSGKWDAADDVDPAAIELQTPSAITPPPLPPASGDILTPSLISTEQIIDKRLLTINWQRPGSMFITGFKLGYTLNGGPMVILAENLQDTTYDMQDPSNGLYEFSIWSVDRRGRLSLPLTDSIDLDELDFRAGSITPGMNRIHFSMFEADTKGWELLANPSTLTNTLVRQELLGYKALTLNFTASAGAQTITVGTDNGYLFPTTAGERLCVQSLLSASTGVTSVEMLVAWYDDSATVISTSSVVVGTPGTGAFTQWGGFVTAPAGALQGELQFKATAASAGVRSISIARPMVNQASPAQVEFPAFTAGPNADNGATRVNYRGDWLTATAYREGDLVVSGGASWGCILAHTSSGGNVPPNATYWAMFSPATYTALLTNESHVVQATSAGVVSDFSTAGGDYKIYVGGAEITSGITFSVASSIGVTISINSTTGIYSVSAMSADQATATLRAVISGVTIDKVYSISKSKAGATGSNGAAGANGADAKSMMIVSTRSGIAYDAAGSASPASQTTSFIAVKQNSTATVTWSVEDAGGTPMTPTTSYLSSSTGNTVFMTEPNFAAARNGTSGVKVIATMTDGTTFTDYISVLRVAQGAAAVGFAQDSPTPSATFVNQTWYKPTAQEWYRATSTGTGGWVRLLGDLASLDVVNTAEIAANAATQTVAQNTSIGSYTLGGVGTASPDMFCIAKLNITTTGNPVHVAMEFFNELYYLSGGAATANFWTKAVMTRGSSGIGINLISAGSPTTFATYSGAGGLTLNTVLALQTTSTQGREALATVVGPQDNSIIGAVDTPAAGTYTYALWWGASDASCRSVAKTRQNIRLTEFKR